MSTANLKTMLLRHEGLRLKVYRCSEGKWTIGVGRNVQDLGITLEEAMALLDHDIQRVLKEATESFPWFNSLNVARQDAILDMLFNLGMENFLEFHLFLDAIRVQNFPVAADEMLKSTWSKQVGVRALELSDIIRLGYYPSITLR